MRQRPRKRGTETQKEVKGTEEESRPVEGTGAWEKIDILGEQRKPTGAKRRGAQVAAQELEWAQSTLGNEGSL